MNDIAPTRTPTRAAFVFVFVTVMLDMLALGIIVPVLPKLVIDFKGGDTASAATIYGLFGTVWAASCAVSGSPYLRQRYGLFKYLKCCMSL
jgi:DHA1 family tetracycline resistance protein-like MFS transporter